MISIFPPFRVHAALRLEHCRHPGDIRGCHFELRPFDQQIPAGHDAGREHPDISEIKSAAAQFISRSGGYDVPATPFLSDPVEHFLHDILHQHDRLQIRKQVEFGFEQRQNGFLVLRRRTAAAVPQF